MTHLAAPSPAHEFWERVGAPAWVAEQDALDRQLRPHDVALLHHAALHDGQRVLDAGCGAGAFTIAAAREVAPHGSVVGVDFSARMLGLAQARVADAGVPVELVEADLTTWRDGDGRFDVVVSRLGLTDSPAMLETLHRALVPGGRLVATVFREITRNTWMLVPTMAVASVLPVALPPSAAGGPFALADPDVLRSHLGAAGFRAVELEALDYTGRMTGPDGGALDVVLAVGPAAAALAKADEAGRAAARAAVDAALAAHDDGHGAVLDAAAWVITARA